MVSKGALVMMCHGLVWAAAIAFWAGASGVAGAATARYDTATPHTPPYNRHRCIPLHGGYESSNDVSADTEDDQPPAYSIGGMAPSEFILTGLRTILDVVRKINKQKAMQKQLTASGHNSTAVALRRTRNLPCHQHHDTTPKPMKQGRYTDPWAGYYDWIINEGSFKFWSVFQLLRLDHQRGFLQVLERVPGNIPCHHHHDTTPKPMKQGRYTDPWAGYYDWIINEGCFKFWSVF
ncbi:hypothetical protein NE865_11668 [Phthorimaea operculella]|nr:hypothetical protein NE865_11668 [Phthorimaea operculella]